MGQIIRCPLVGTPCMKPITVQEKTFFLAEAEKPEDDKRRRTKAISEAIVDGYKIRSALEEKGINAFTCKICEMIQTCAYGMADISQNNANVYMELGMMLALGKPTVILAKKGQEKQLNLPSDLNAIEIIPFEEYLDIIDPLREIVNNLPPAIIPSSPIEDLEKIQPQFAQEIRKIGAEIAEEFKDSIKAAKLDTVVSSDAKAEIPPELSEKLRSLEEKLEDIRGLGFITDANTAFLRGNYFANQGRYEEALACYNWYLELKPDHPDALYNRGTTYARLERYEEALADYTRALELRPDHPETLNNRGITYAKLERYEEALADYNRALELKPDDTSTLFNLACLFSLWRKNDDALHNLEKAIYLDNKYREMAKTDKDFDNIRDDPRFKKLMEPD